MRIQRVTRRGGVSEERVPGAGATPVLRTSRAGSAALVAPAPGTPGVQKISGVDTGCICAEYNRIGLAPIADLYRLSNRYARNHNFADRRTK
jgi:hypothetical protein